MGCFGTDCIPSQSRHPTIDMNEGTLSIAQPYLALHTYSPS